MSPCQINFPRFWDIILTLWTFICKRVTYFCPFLTMCTGPRAWYTWSQKSASDPKIWIKVVGLPNLTQICAIWALSLTPCVRGLMKEFLLLAVGHWIHGDNRNVYERVSFCNYIIPGGNRNWTQNYKIYRDSSKKPDFVNVPYVTFPITFVSVNLLHRHKASP